MSILIVDDSQYVQLLLKAFLEPVGYTDVLSAASAQGAFKHLGMDNPVSSTAGVDLILMDITMPGMDGVEACRRIKATPMLRDIPIIVVTAHDEAKYLNEAFVAGAIDYIRKPVDKVELLPRVRSALTLKQEMDSRKRAYAKLEQESLAKTQILATVTHELRTPLTSIMGYVDMLLVHQEKVGSLNERQQKYLDYVQEDSRILKALIDDLLDISRIEADSLELTITELEVQPEIEHVIRSLQNQFAEKEIRVALEVPPDLCLVKADRLRFSQVVTNLVSNAYKYSPAGATITITAVENNGLIHIDVSDTGMGISKEDQSRLFTKFFRADNSSTRAEAGTGLGLYITKLLIEAQEGQIWVQSELGTGSTFSFNLPVAGGDVTGQDMLVHANLPIMKGQAA